MIDFMSMAENKASTTLDKIEKGIKKLSPD